MEQRMMPSLIDQIRGVSYKPTDLHDSLNAQSITLLRANNIDDGKINFDDVVYVDRKCVSQSQLLRKGDILICASSGSRNLVGKAAQVDFEGEYTFGAFCKVVRPKLIRDVGYIGMFFQSPIYRRTIAEKAQGININNIRGEHIDSMYVRWPDQVDRQKAVETYQALRDCIRLRQRQLRTLDTLIKARFVEMFGGNKYPTKTVKDVLSDSFWLMPATPQYIEKGIPYITSKNIKNRVLDFCDTKFISEDDYLRISRNRPVKPGDILVSMIGTLGQTAIVPKDKRFYGQNVYLLRLDNYTINTAFFCEFFNSDDVQNILAGKCNQSTQAYLKANHVEDLLIPIAPIEVQNQFASFVAQVDKSKIVVQKALDEAQLLYNCLMQKYFG